MTQIAPIKNKAWARRDGCCRYLAAIEMGGSFPGVDKPAAWVQREVGACPASALGVMSKVVEARGVRLHTPRGVRQHMIQDRLGSG